MDAHIILSALVPVILLLLLGVIAAVGSRAIGLSPIVGYLALGLGLRGAGLNLVADGGMVSTLAELGVVFLLFDIGLHFSLSHVRSQAKDIFGFGPVQVLAGTLGLGLVAMLFGLKPLAAFLVGATLALSSTAVVVRLIDERHQQNCPVGLTATAILIFQDVAAIFLLIVANALDSHEAILPSMGLALLKAAGAFAVAVALGRLVVRPLFALVARGRNEEVFTGMALLVALAAGWATGSIGLSLTLGAFLGGMIIAETPYRVVIQSEIKPFRGLLLGFFFISVGLSLDLNVLLRAWPAVIGVTLLLLAVKIVTNAAASITFRWSVPGSTQLGFLLAQGSEFGFVILSLPAVRALVGEQTSAVLIAAIALSLAATPTLAEAGRSLAGRMRRRKAAMADAELQPREADEPVFIMGMGAIGRTLADALTEFEIGYAAIERDEKPFRDAVADGYNVAFGDLSDPKIWEPVALHGRRMIILTAPSFEVSRDLGHVARMRYPDLKRIAVVQDEAEAEQFRSIGLQAIINLSVPPGLDLAILVLAELGIDQAKVDLWTRRQRDRARLGSQTMGSGTVERETLGSEILAA